MTEYQVREAILWAENDLPLTIHLDFDFYNNFAKKKMKGVYNRDSAIKFLNSYFFPRIMHRYLIETGNKTLYGMNKEEKTQVSDYLLRQLEEEGGYVLENPPLNEINGKIKLKNIDNLCDFYQRERVKAYEIPRNSLRKQKNTPIY